MRLSEHRILVDGQVDHTVRHDDVDAVIGKRHAFDATLEKFRVRHPGFRLVGPGNIGLGVMSSPSRRPCRPTRRGKQQHVNTYAGAKVAANVTGLQRRQRHRVGAADATRQASAGSSANSAVS